jgi:hypothetical protein
MSGNFTRRVKIAAYFFVAALLTAGLLAGGAYAQKKSTEPSPSPAPQPTPSPAPQPQPGGVEQPKLPSHEVFSQPTDNKTSPSPQFTESPGLPKGFEKKLKLNGTREDTEATAGYAEDAYNIYQKMCSDGTAEQKAAAEKEWRSWKYLLEEWQAVAEALRVKEVREANDERDHFYTIYARLDQNPNSAASDLAKAKADWQKATIKYVDLLHKTAGKILTEIKTKFTYDGPESCPVPSETPPPEEKKKKKKKNKGDTSGPLDFLGNVTLGVGVGGHGDHHRDEDRRDEKSHGDRDKKEHGDKQDESKDKEKNRDNISHEPDHHDHEDNQASPPE